MKELFDVHCHMVPGVDDGAADLEESLAMLKMQHEDGVRKIIITPHYRRRMFETPAKKVHEQFLKLQEAAKKEYPDMSLYLGCELHSNMDLQDIPENREIFLFCHALFFLFLIDIMTALSAVLFQNVDITNHHAAVHRLAHIVDREQRCGNASQRLHLHAGLSDT